MNQDQALTRRPRQSTATPPTVLAIFEAQVRHAPGAIAVSCGETKLSYAELDRQANQLAHHLLSLGVMPGDRVALCMGRSVDLIVAMLGVVKAGAAYLPMDLAYPRERLAFMLSDADAVVVLTLSADRNEMPESSAQVVCLDADREDIAQESQLAPDIDHGSASLAYVIYTSGSTGKPKGCQVTHGNLSWFFAASDRRFEFTHADVWAFVLSQAFDVSGFEIWGALTHGARLVVVPQPTIRSPEALRDLLLHERVTVMCQTPTAFLQLMRVDEAVVAPSGYALRYVILGGEALEPQSLRPWLQRYGDRRPQLVNMYGPTETTIYVTNRVITCQDLEQGVGSVIGTGLPGVCLHVLDDELRPVRPGSDGELCVGGAAVTLGYLKRPEDNARQFIQWRDPRTTDAQTLRLYRTGDLVRQLPDGDIEYIGRRDHQVKLHGFRIELGEIEATLARHPAVRACAVVAREDRPGDKRLVAYIVPQGQMPPVDVLRAHLALTLPDFMLPSAFVSLSAFPQNENGKLDRRSLPVPARDRPELSLGYEPALNPIEQDLCDAFSDLLQVEGIGRHDNFFNLGGNSLLAARLIQRLRQQRADASEADPAVAGSPVAATLLFQHPTPAALALALSGGSGEGSLLARMPHGSRADAPHREGIDAGISEPIAIVAMAGRFPGAADVEAFWKNLCEGRDSITRFDADQLDPSIDPSDRSDPAYVPARGVIEGVEDFDAAFFGISHKEAELTDPQHRIFLELCWECMERAGHVPDAADVPVGVFAGMYDGTYFQRHLMPRPDLIRQVGAMAVSFLNEKDYFATRVANKLNLTGPAINVQTACSTSLVAICQAVDSLRAGHCDMALAGGASVTCPPRSGYMYEEGAIFSSDGHTRAFDRDAKGTVFSDGATVVLLKRLSDARADGNHVYAVIRGGAVNNDGGGKASFAAPSSEGQAAVITMAHRNAGVDPRSISYVEAHGTGTPVGDPIELEGLTRAFRRGTADTGFCRIGSVKSNVGHLVIAAGGAGVIKTALALSEHLIPPSLHFHAPNPTIDFAGSPFVVNASLSEWGSNDGSPRRAGVSSFGVGGTNAHVVLEEAPAVPDSEACAGPQLLVLSARTPAALTQACVRLADHLHARSPANLADVAWTLSAGRKSFAHRVALVADDIDDAIARLRSAETAAAVQRTRPARQSTVVFMFPGQGATYAGMGRGLYQDMPVFRSTVDECAEVLRNELGFDLRDALFDDDPQTLLPTSIMQPATFTIEFSLARLWMSQGVMPTAMVGHSVGEFVAATLAGIFTLPDALRLVARRGALMQTQPAGGMLSVQMACDRLVARLPPRLSLAAENAPGACVVAGPVDEIEQFQANLKGEGVACRTLRTSHAFHSPMMDPVIAPLQAELEALTLAPPQVPLVSSMTGEWLDAETATCAGYWARQLREPVHFATALGRLLEAPSRVLLEVGPRAMLSALARRHPLTKLQQIDVVTSLSDGPASESVDFRLAAGQLWCSGVALDPSSLDRRRLRHRLVLPTYPFERERCWLEATAANRAHMPSSRAAVPVAAVNAAETADVQIPSHAAQAPDGASVIAGGRVDRKARLTAQLRDVFEEVTGFDLASADPATSFIELGLDSLMLTQLALQLSKTFIVKITFRQLMGECANLGDLAGLLDRQLPPESNENAAATPPASADLPIAVVQPPNPTPASVHPDVLEGIAQQMHQITRQLALLAGEHDAAASPVVPSKLQPSPGACACTPQTPSRRRSAAPGRRASEATPDQYSGAQTPYDANEAFGAIARIHQSEAGLTAEQHERLDTFERRYIARTQRSRDYNQQHRSHLADPRVVSGFRPLLKEITYPIVVDRSHGSHLWDLDDNEYIDAANGFGMNLFGWQPKFVRDALRRQLDIGYELGPQHPLAGEVAKLVCEITGFDRAGLCNTGSEAVLGTIRIARTTTGRSTLVVFSGSYHGIFDEVIVRGTKTLRSIPAAPGILRNAAENVLVLDYGTPEALAIIRERAHAIAAVLVEPVQSRRPEFQPVEFLQELRMITREAGTVLIFDEVVTGFRSDPRGAQGVFGIDADLAAYGKVLGGGLPIGVIAGKRQYMDALDGGQWQFGNDSIPTVGVTYFAGTFVRHPLALAAAKAVLEHIKAAGPALQQLLNARTAAMAAELNAFCAEVQAPIEITYFASMWRIKFTDVHPLQDLLFAMMRSRGIHVLDNFPCFFTTAHSEADYAAVARAFRESVVELQEARFISGSRSIGHAVLDASRPPTPGARLGRDPTGNPAWFVANPERAGGFLKVVGK